MSIINKTRGMVVAKRVSVANTFFSRMRGLIGKSFLANDEALVITKCTSIHMFFMRFPIDAIFVDSDNQVVGIVSGIKPFQLSKIYWKASFVIEIAAGVISVSKTGVGDILEITKGLTA